MGSRIKTFFKPTVNTLARQDRRCGQSGLLSIFEPSREKTNNGVSEQTEHETACTVTEGG